MKKQQTNRRLFLLKTLGITAGITQSKALFASPISKKTSVVVDEVTVLKDKHKEMRLLSDRPINLEAAPHLLNDAVTPYDKMFVRNNGNVPEEMPDATTWTLEISGESITKNIVFTLQELKTQFSVHTYSIVLECGGNGRSDFSPTTAGNQWKEGAVSCAEWTGVRLRDVLEKVGIKNDAVYVGYYGKDTHLSGDTQKATISRGVPIKKALEDETLLAWQMNGENIPLLHGFPLRLVVGGYPASVSGKWLHKIVVRNKIHDGEKMDGNNYRVPTYPIEPGEKIQPDNEMKIIEAMPVKSLITFPKSGAVLQKNTNITIKGHAWAGDTEVKNVHISTDFGVTWLTCKLHEAKNKNAWQQWEIEINFQEKGYYELWAKATDKNGTQQPMVTPAWNPGGYLNNACHRIALKIHEQ